jgi:GDP-L-fucose synthase
MKKVFISGSGGFIGGNLKNFLKGKYELFTPRSFEFDLRDKNAVREYFKVNNIDFIIHAATVGGQRGFQDKPETVEENLSMLDNLLENKKQNTRMILFGSGAMYGRYRDLKKVKEEEIGKHIPTELYGKSKMLIAQKIIERDDVLCLNIFGCYGLGEKPSRFPSYAINRNLNRETIEINQNVVFDYLFIDDLMKIIGFFIENKPKNNILNAAPDKSISLKEISELVNEISDFKSEIIIKNDKMNFEYTGDNSLLRSEIPNLEFTSYFEGLKKFYFQLKKFKSS